MTSTRSDIFVVPAAILGACGVALAAAASHGEGTRLYGAAAALCLAHAPALLALAILADGRKGFGAAGFMMAAGTALFAGDMVARVWAGTALFAFAAPVGGALTIAGWLVLGAAALVALVRRRAR